MATVTFTSHLRGLPGCAAPAVAPGATLREVLDACFGGHPAARGYVLDDQGALRPHVAVFVDGRQVADRVLLSDPVGADSEVHVLQALSGG